MAIILYSALISTIRGKINGSVFSKSGAGQIVGNRGIPRRTPSRAQQDQRSGFTTNAQQWATLTDQQRGIWRNMAATIPVQNRIGETVFLSGWLYFRKMMGLIFPSGSTTPILANPMAGDALEQTFGVNEFIVTPQGSEYLCELASFQGVTINATATPQHYIIWVSLPLSAGQSSYFGTYYRIGEAAFTPPGAAGIEIFPTLTNQILSAGWFTFEGANHRFKIQSVVGASGSVSVEKFADLDNIIPPIVPAFFGLFGTDPSGNGGVSQLSNMQLQITMSLLVMQNTGNKYPDEITFSIEFAAPMVEPYSPSELSYIAFCCVGFEYPPPFPSWVQFKQFSTITFGEEYAVSIPISAPVAAGSRLPLRWRYTFQSSGVFSPYYFDSYPIITTPTPIFLAIFGTAPDGTGGVIQQANNSLVIDLSLEIASDPQDIFPSDISFEIWFGEIRQNPYNPALIPYDSIATDGFINPPTYPNYAQFIPQHGLGFGRWYSGLYPITGAFPANSFLPIRWRYTVPSSGFTSEFFFNNYPVNIFPAPDFISNLGISPDGFGGVFQIDINDGESQLAMFILEDASQLYPNDIQFFIEYAEISQEVLDPALLFYAPFSNVNFVTPPPILSWIEFYSEAVQSFAQQYKSTFPFSFFFPAESILYLRWKYVIPSSGYISTYVYGSYPVQLL